MIKKDQPLTGREKKVCRHYLVDWSPERAAVKSGYAKTGAAKAGQRILRKPAAQVFLQKLMDDRSQRLDVSQDKIVAEYAKLAFSNLTHFV